MKKILFILAALSLSACTNWESEALDVPHDIVYQDDQSAIIVYENDYGIDFTDPDVDLSEDQEAYYDLLFGHFFNETSRTKQDYICLNETPPEKVPLVTWHVKCPALSTGCGGASRQAFICDDQYAIGAFDLAQGPLFYGPFDLSTHELLDLTSSSS